MMSRTLVAISGNSKLGNHVVVLCLLLGNASSSELCLHLHKPYLWVCRPELWNFDVCHCDGDSGGGGGCGG